MIRPSGCGTQPGSPAIAKAAASWTTTPTPDCSRLSGIRCVALLALRLVAWHGMRCPDRHPLH
jgi:hypothetical protein